MQREATKSNSIKSKRRKQCKAMHSSTEQCRIMQIGATVCKASYGATHGAIRGATHGATCSTPKIRMTWAQPVAQPMAQPMTLRNSRMRSEVRTPGCKHCLGKNRPPTGANGPVQSVQSGRHIPGGGKHILARSEVRSSKHWPGADSSPRARHL